MLVLRWLIDLLGLNPRGLFVFLTVGDEDELILSTLLGSCFPTNHLIGTRRQNCSRPVMR